MALKTGGGLQTVTLVLTQEQVRKLRAMQCLENTGANRVSMSDVGRRVVEAGLSRVSHAAHSDSVASDSREDAA